VGPWRAGRRKADGTAVRIHHAPERQRAPVDAPLRDQERSGLGGIVETVEKAGEGAMVDPDLPEVTAVLERKQALGWPVVCQDRSGPRYRDGGIWQALQIAGQVPPSRVWGPCADRRHHLVHTRAKPLKPGNIPAASIHDRRN